MAEDRRGSKPRVDDDGVRIQIVGGKNPQWNAWGHERMGWGLSVFNP